MASSITLIIILVMFRVSNGNAVFLANLINCIMAPRSKVSNIISDIDEVVKTAQHMLYFLRQLMNLTILVESIL